MNRVPFLQFLSNQTERYKQATQKGINGKKLRSINRLLVTQNNQRFEFHRHGETKQIEAEYEFREDNQRRRA